MKLTEYFPKWDQVVVEQLTESVTAGGLYLPHHANSEFTPCRVLKVGRECKATIIGEVVIINNFNVLAVPLEFSDTGKREIYTTRETNLLGGSAPNPND